MELTVRPMTRDDWPTVAEIYASGIASGDATFETGVPGWEVWNGARHPHCRLVAEAGGRVVGFACVTPVSKRSVYRGVAEVMVYVADGVRGVGVGSRLMAALVACTDAHDIWTLQASIFPENVASIRAHERVGFRVVGTRERIGRFHDGRWRDTVFVERRSSVAGRE